jgi:aminoglycoside phosphotransferase (APT) family kinase protein
MELSVNTKDLQRIAAGREAEIYAWEDGKVLRLFFNPGAGEAVQREAAAMEAVRAVLPLVPAVESVVEIEGRPGLILDRVDGPDLLTRLKQKPWTTWQAGATTGKVHAELHDVTGPDSLPDVKARIERNLFRTDAVPVKAAERARAALGSVPDGNRLLHGDMHPANVILSPSGLVVIDWPNATRGDPTADVARSLVIGRAHRPPVGTPRPQRLGEFVGSRLVFAAHLRAYRRVHAIDEALLKRWMAIRAAERLAEQIPEERAWLLHYVQTAIADGRL